MEMKTINSSPDAIAAIDSLFKELQENMEPLDFDAVMAYVNQKYLFSL
jgi:hypothetical protein